jgi:hypothetical protein
MRLSDTEYEEITSQLLKMAHPEITTFSPETKTRILCNCLARGQSIQILGPVGEDMWKDIAFIKIEGLVAMDEALQFGYPVSMAVFREGLRSQKQRISARRGKA